MKTVTSRTLAVSGSIAALAAGAALAAMPAGAASSTFKVTAGSAKSGTTVSFKGKATGTSAKPAIHFTDKQTAQTLTCKSGTSKGTMKVGKGQSGTGLSQVDGSSLNFSGCTGPGGLDLVVTGVGTWSLNASKYSSTGGGTVTGSLTKVVSHVKDTTGGTACKFTASGTVPSNFLDKTDKLVMPGKAADLKVSKVTGCFGAVNNGDHATFKATFAVKSPTKADNPIKITAG
jgi:hypothetical protein